MRTTIILTLLLFSKFVFANELNIYLTETKRKVFHTYILNYDSFKIKEGQLGGKTMLNKKSQLYATNFHTLLCNGNKLTDGTEILYETHINNSDLLIVREEQTSISSPSKLLAGIAGHPRKEHKLFVLKIKECELIEKKELDTKVSSTHWKVILKH